MAPDPRLAAAAPDLLAALKGALLEIELNTCEHEDTYRGGAIWTICHRCGAKWADDEGGFVPHQDSTVVVSARAAIAKAEGREP